MKYDHLASFEKHLKSAAPQHFSSLYCVLGKDSFECREGIDLLLHALIPSHEKKESVLSILDGSQLEEGELGRILHSYSLFTKTQIFWISQADKLKKNILDSLEKYFTHTHPGQYLLFSAPTLHKGSAFYKSLEKHGVVLELAELKLWEKEKQLIEWTNKKITAARKMITYPVCQFIVKQAGNDRGSLIQEVEKLLCYCLEKKEITQQDVEAVGLLESNDTVWQLGEAIFCRNAGLALHIAQSLLHNGQVMLPLLRQIRSQFQTEYQLCLLLAQGKQPQDITAEFPHMKGQILDRHIRQARLYGLDAFRKGILAIDAIEVRLKNSSVDEMILMELLIVQLTK